MAQLHDNAWSDGGIGNNPMRSIGPWTKPTSDESGPRKAIEVRGAAYIAFCKAWAPLWIDEDEAVDFD